MVEFTLGQIGYMAYCETSGNKSLITGAELPVFSQCKPEVQDAWEKAGQAIAAALGRGGALTGMVNTDPAEAELKVGDVVWLKSGGPPITVNRLLTAGDDLVFCKWFDFRGTPFEGHFAKQALTTRVGETEHITGQSKSGETGQNIGQIDTEKETKCEN